jgi:hypothetical protein
MDDATASGQDLPYRASSSQSGSRMSYRNELICRESHPRSREHPPATLLPAKDPHPDRPRIFGLGDPATPGIHPSSAPRPGPRGNGGPGSAGAACAVGSATAPHRAGRHQVGVDSCGPIAAIKLPCDAPRSPPHRILSWSPPSPPGAGLSTSAARGGRTDSALAYGPPG